MIGSRPKLTLVDEFVPRDYDGWPNAIFLDRLGGRFEKGDLALQAHFAVIIVEVSSLEYFRIMSQVDLRESKRAAANAEKPRNRR